MSLILIQLTEKNLNFKSQYLILNPPALTDLLVCSTAPTTGGPGHGTRQTGDHGGAKCFDRGTWAPPSASERVYLILPFIYIPSFSFSFLRQTSIGPL